VVEADGGQPCLVARLSAHRPDEGLLIVASGDPIGDIPMEPRRALQGGVMAAVGLMALALVRRRELVPSRDIVLAVIPGRGPYTTPRLRDLVARQQNRLRCRLVLTSDGSAPGTPGNRKLIGIQAASKAFVRVVVRSNASDLACGPDSAPLRLLRSLLQLESGVLATRPCLPATAWLDAVASTLPSRPAAMLRGFQFLGAGTVLSRFVQDQDLAATLASISRDTAEIVGLRAGEAAGLPAGQAEADVVLRILPGRRVEECVLDLASLLGSEVSVEAVDSVLAVETPPMTPLWIHIADAIEHAIPGALPVPTLSIEPWDAAALAHIETTSYGFGPLSVLDDDELTTPDGTPGITRESLRRGADAMTRVILGTCIPNVFPLGQTSSR
jgi:hypothetical protein